MRWQNIGILFAVRVQTKWKNKKMKTSYIILAMISMLLAFSCTKQDRENTIVSQEEAIDSYINSMPDATVVRNGGSNRIVIDSGNAGGSEVAVGDSLYIRYAGYIFSRGKGALFVTNNEDVAKEQEFPCMEAPEKIKLGSTGLVKGLELGLNGVREGEHCYIIFSAKYGYNNTQVSNISKLTPLFYEVWVDKVIKN